MKFHIFRSKKIGVIAETISVNFVEETGEKIGLLVPGTSLHLSVKEGGPSKYP